MIKLNYDKPTMFKDLRYEQRLTCREFAAKINITPGAYHHLERGNTWPSFGTILKTMEVFDVPINRFEQYFREREDHIKKAAIRPNSGTRRKES